MTNNPNNDGFNHPEGYTSYGENSYGENNYGANGYGENGYGENGYGEGGYGQQNYDSAYGQQYGANGYNQQYAQPGFGAAAPVNNLALAALIVGIVSLLLLLLFPWIAVPGGIAAIVLGVMGQRKAKEIQAAAGGYPVQTRKGMAIGGLVTGIITLLVGAALLIFGFWIWNQVQGCEQYIDDPAALEKCVEERLLEKFESN
ncbi:DUF4190 domain-containing protein [Corynebacterium riegelii]|uniref:DUF4190 domain-containing protein n=1 Tax=Corynebacterium riegelii TaxID=156976 RepID=UPI0028897F98|nr:DUF4190 domain-containing protein [Corynebacterium riegelii]